MTSVRFNQRREGQTIRALKMGEPLDDIRKPPFTALYHAAISVSGQMKQDNGDG